MTFAQGILVALVAIVMLASAAWFSWTAGRLDRMHLRCARVQAALDAELAHRRALALELAGSVSTDRASALLLVDAATPTTSKAEADRWQRESDLSAVLRAVLPQTGSTADDLAGTSPEVVDELAAVALRIGLARRIHNDLVATTLALRARRRVRWFRLAGHAEPPAMISFDDEPPSVVGEA
jgi:hypothetical protein